MRRPFLCPQKAAQTFDASGPRDWLCIPLDAQRRGKQPLFTCTVQNSPARHAVRISTKPQSNRRKAAEMRDVRRLRHQAGIKAAQRFHKCGARISWVRDTASVRSGSIPYGICAESSPILRHDLPQHAVLRICSGQVILQTMPERTAYRVLLHRLIRMYDRPDKHIQHAPKQRLLYFRNRFLPKGVDRQTQPSRFGRIQWFKRLRTHGAVDQTASAKVRAGSPALSSSDAIGTLPRPESELCAVFRRTAGHKKRGVRPDCRRAKPAETATADPVLEPLGSPAFPYAL